MGQVLIRNIDDSVRAGEIAIDLNHPIYDCLYIALAERENCVLVSADEAAAQNAPHEIRENRDTSFWHPALNGE